MITSMNTVKRDETKFARLLDPGARHLTVGHLRQFLSEVDNLGMPDTTRVHYDSKLNSEGGTSSIAISASQTLPIEEEIRQAEKHLESISNAKDGE